MQLKYRKMRYVILSLLILLLQSPDALDKELYLLYDQNNERIEKVRLGSTAPPTFLYQIQYGGKNYGTLALDELNPSRRDTIRRSQISSIKYKTIDWLTEKYLEHYNYFKGDHPRIDDDGTLRTFNLNKIYEKIYIVIPDSYSGKAVITQVKYNPYFSID